MAFFNRPEWICRLPLAVYVHVLVVESCWRVVPLCDLDWFILVDHRDDVQSVSTAVGIVIVWDRVKVTIG